MRVLAIARWVWGLGIVAGVGVGWGQSTALLLPAAVAYDSGGDLFFVDTNRHQVFEVTLGGVLSVVAGTGVQGFGGDGGVATAALLNGPQGVAVGADGTVYVADTGNQRVRAVAGGVISTFAGTGVAGFGGDGGVATAALLSGPVGLAVDGSGALLICDAGNERVRRVLGGVMETFAGSGVEGFGGDGGAATAGLLNGPVGVAVLGDGRVVIADEHNARLRVVGVNGVMATFAGTGVVGFSGDGGAATLAELALPRGVTVDAAGDVIFADANNQRLRMVNAAGVISTIAGAGWQGLAVDGTVAVGGALNTPRGVGVAADGATVFADSPNRLVREVAANGDVYTVAVVSPARVTAVGLKVGSPVIYGSGSAGVSVSGVATPMGVVSVVDSGVGVGSATVVGGTATVGLAGLGVGSHVLSADYAGDGLNPAAVSLGVQVSVVQAASSTSVAAQNGYASLPLVMTAAVSPQFAGVPTGTVAFEDGGVVIAHGTLANGVATGTYLAPGAGAHVLTAVYAGDVNFVGSSSVGDSVTVAAMPDFVLAATGPGQVVQGGLIASYPLMVTAVGGAFTGAVSFSVTGLQSGATVSFSPPMVVPGGAAVPTVMSVQTVALAESAGPKLVWWGLPLVVVCCLRRRRLAWGLLLVAMMGCGARTVSTEAGSKSYMLTVTGTGTNLAGAVVTHATSVSLKVE